jgi:hypothetical protein
MIQQAWTGKKQEKSKSVPCAEPYAKKGTTFMDTTQTENPTMITHWAPLVQDDFSFQALISEDAGRVPTESDLVAGEHGLKCQQCQSIVPIESCMYCGGTHYAIRTTAYNQLGLFCRTCTRPYERMRCSCGTVIPVARRALMKKNVVEEIPPATIIRWVIAAMVGLVLVVLFLKAV